MKYSACVAVYKCRDSVTSFMHIYFLQSTFWQAVLVPPLILNVFHWFCWHTPGFFTLCFSFLLARLHIWFFLKIILVEGKFLFQHCSNDLSSCIILSYISQEGPSNGTAARDVEAAAPHQGHGGGGHDHEEVGCFFFF